MALAAPSSVSGPPWAATVRGERNTGTLSTVTIVRILDLLTPGALRDGWRRVKTQGCEYRKVTRRHRPLTLLIARGQGRNSRPTLTGRGRRSSIAPAKRR